MVNEPTQVYRAANAQQAYLLKSLLEDEGISAHVVNDLLQAAGGDLPLGWVSLPQVLVGAEDLPRALEVVANFEAHVAALVADSTEPDGIHLAVNPREVTIPDDIAFLSDDLWPRCIKCSERRQVTCSYCGESGNSFPIIDDPTDLSGEEEEEDAPSWPRLERNRKLLVHCTTCDEHFLADFYPVCHSCGYEFEKPSRSTAASSQPGDSSDAGAVDPYSSPREVTGNQSRIAAVFIGMVLAIAAIVIYFILLL